MVIPWDGFPLGDLLKRFEPPAARRSSSSHRLRPAEMPGQRAGFPPCCRGRTSKGSGWTRRCTRWRLIAVGLYGETLPNQNGAPLRLVVPWRYGFKGIKSIVKIRFVDKQPLTTVVQPEPQYGFYANVNPTRPNSTWRHQSTNSGLATSSCGRP